MHVYHAGIIEKRLNLGRVEVSMHPNSKYAMIIVLTEEQEAIIHAGISCFVS